MNARVEHVADEADVAKKLGGGPAIFLSASVPYKRTIPAGMNSAERRKQEALNRSYLKSARPARVRSAVTALTRLMMKRGVRLVFGAHPAISPMVLSAAGDVLVNLERASDKKSKAKEPRIIIFQSQYFERELPNSTLDLASWEAGLLVFTPVVAGKSTRSEDSRGPSLARMRELMVSVPDLRAGILVGGMEGVADEAELFRKRNPGKPVYALASTGSAAQELWQHNPTSYAGSLRSPSLLEDSPSYSVVAGHILDDLNIDWKRP